MLHFVCRYIPFGVLARIALNVFVGIYGTGSVGVKSSKYKNSKIVVLIPPAFRAF